MKTLRLVCAAVVVSGGLYLLVNRTDDAKVPQNVVTPSWYRTHETRPLFTSCVHAQLAGAPLPLTVGDPGWNPRLDYDHNGLAC